MINLLQLELKKNNIRTYIISASIVGFCMLGIIYLFAYAPKIEPKDPDMKMFAGYGNIIPLFNTISMFAFSLLSSVMFSKIVIEEYAGKRTVLLFSYPISRSKVFLAKISLVSLFVATAMITSSIIIFIIFGISESISPVVDGNITFEIIKRAAKTTFFMSISAVSVGIISMAIGFIKKSIPTTIISAVLLCSLLSNIVAGSISTDSPMVIFTIILVLISVLVINIMTRTINCMEV
ncbi:ABC-type transport system involved in multi-copper enzyme maturation permease subunit [Bacillus sp. SORGH_AS 510]|uniref:ABC transporter permease n=1 Tax=Bacillus sp. SORGH_AS_0510 TaxID=3041771 RepID=UPI00278A9B20|nr:ABC transporter permease [Bacillus sp. SORGH_AS_0510]MDQ1143432.1 ABC-type transport system involved in multi-copper enzyme maturation permease subunit [Bacillus sp. SORGH_AS_0510]